MLLWQTRKSTGDSASFVLRLALQVCTCASLRLGRAATRESPAASGCGRRACLSPVWPARPIAGPEARTQPSAKLFRAPRVQLALTIARKLATLANARFGPISTCCAVVLAANSEFGAPKFRLQTRTLRASSPASNLKFAPKASARNRIWLAFRRVGRVFGYVGRARCDWLGASTRRLTLKRRPIAQVASQLNLPPTSALRSNEVFATRPTSGSVAPLKPLKPLAPFKPLKPLDPLEPLQLQ